MTPKRSDPPQTHRSVPTRRSVHWAWLILSAGVVAAAIQQFWRESWFWLLPFVLVGYFWVPPLLAKYSLRRLVLRGDVQSLLASWDHRFESREAEATVRPLLRATVLAAHGWAVRAEQVLDLAQKGRLWDQSLEHRLMLASLLACLNGDNEHSLALAECLEQLPLPRTSSGRKRAVTLRRGTLAMARAYAHQSQQDDVRWMQRCARVNPLLTWPMRYAEALVRIDRGELNRARSLLANVPNWPTTSRFHAFTGVLRARLYPEAP
jgi:hypothetical protein